MKKFHGRIYLRVDPDDVRPKDVVFFSDHGTRIRVVVSVAKNTVMVDQPKGLKPDTKRVHRRDIKEVWRWRGAS